MLRIENLTPEILRGIAGVVGETTYREDDEIPPEVLQEVRELNAFQGIDAYLKALGVEGQTGKFIQAVDELRSAEYSDQEPT
jgi:hypothetical protein